MSPWEPPAPWQPPQPRQVMTEQMMAWQAYQQQQRHAMYDKALLALLVVALVVIAWLYRPVVERAITGNGQTQGISAGEDEGEIVTEKQVAGRVVATMPSRRPNLPANPTKAELAAFAEWAANKYGLPPTLLLRQILQESGFTPSARSSAGARGIAQIMPATAAAWDVNPHRVDHAIEAMAKHMAGYWHTYQRQGYSSNTAYRMALSAYNAGTGAVAKYKGVPPYAETRNYVASIMADRL